MHQKRSLDRETHVEPQDERESTSEGQAQRRKKPAMKYSSILKSPAFKRELESLNKQKTSEMDKISSILKN